MPIILNVALTRRGLPSACRSTTSACLWTGDHVGTASMSASASRIASGGASKTTSLDALRTAILAQSSYLEGLTQPLSQLIFFLPIYLFERRGDLGRGPDR